MQQKTTTLKSINYAFFFTFLLSLFAISTQAQKVKIDGVAVVIGKNIVLESDIEKFKQEVELRSEGKITISDCEMLEELMQQKLLSHHAVIDSVMVADAEISGRVENTIQYFTKEMGSLDKVIQTYGFNDLDDLKKELYDVQKENLLIEREQQKITEKVDVTPEEVRLYYNGLKEKGELPQIPAEIELAQVVLKVSPTQEEIDRVLKKLNDLKKEIEEGASFKMKAIINSDDGSVTQNGGNLGEITRQTNFVNEFKEVAFSLDLGQISKPFKTVFGYHIIKLNAIKGNARDVSHILIEPDIPETRLLDTKARAEQIAKDVKEGKITFEEAVKKYSEDKATKNSGGLIVNPYTGEHRFDLTRMDPALYARVVELNKGDLSDVFYEEERGEGKMYKFFLMRDRVDTHAADLVDDYVKVQELALIKKKEEIITKWSKDKIKDTYIKMSSTYQKCNFEKNWKKETNK